MYKKAVITILGIQGGFVSKEKEVKFTNFENKATYSFTPDTNGKKEYFNTLPLLIDRFRHTHTIVPLYTVDAKMFNEEVLKKGYPNLHLDFDLKYLIHDEQNFDEVFALIEETVNAFDELIIDVSHGFRHLPILMIVDLIIQNFKDTQKIKHIYFAKEIVKHDKEVQGHYEIIDLKEYLDLANIAFILSTFEQNYTVANHIQSPKYASLINALNSFSNDIMALNLNNLFKTSGKALIDALGNVDNASIKDQAKKLVETIDKLINNTKEQRYQTYFDLAKDLAHKNYMLLSLSLLFESVRLYIKSSIEKNHGLLIADVEKQFNNDLYKIGDFCKNLSWKSYKQFQNDKRKINISEKDYELLRKAYPKFIEKLYEHIDKKRNNLAHANASGTFKDIKNEIISLLSEYEELCIKQKTANDLEKYFNR